MKCCAGTDRAFDVNFASMLLNNAVGNREAKASAATVAGHVFGGEKGIVDALQVLGRDARAGIGDDGLNVAVDQDSDRQAPAAGHRVLGVQQQVEKDLLQFARIAVDRRQPVGQIEIDKNLRRFELVLKKQIGRA